MGSKHKHKRVKSTQTAGEAIMRLIGTSTIGECWLWKGPDNGAGYGFIWHQGNRWLTHRLAYTLLVGPIPDGLVLDHLCRNPACWNPCHLEPIEHKINIRRGWEHVREECKEGHQDWKINSRGHRYCAECDRQRHRKN